MGSQVHHLIGKTVRCEVEVGGGSKYYGKHGTCVSIDEKEGMANVMTDIELHKIPLGAVRQRTAKEVKVAELKNFQGTSEVDKQVVMMMSGFGWDTEREETIGSVTNSKPKLFEKQQLSIYAALIQWTLSNKHVMIYNADYIQVLSGSTHFEVEADVLERVRSAFRAALHRYERHIFPLSSVTDASTEHWTVLVIESVAQLVRYYESLEEMKHANVAMAKGILEILGLTVPLERTNTFRQVEEECGEIACHYIELECRHAAGEGWGSVEGFTRGRWQEMRKKLGATCAILKKTQLGFKAREETEAAQAAAMNKLKDAALGETQRMMLRVQDIKERGNAAANEDFFNGLDAELELPEGWGEKKKKKSNKRIVAKSTPVESFKTELEQQNKETKQKKEAEEMKSKEEKKNEKTESDKGKGEEVNKGDQEKKKKEAEGDEKGQVTEKPHENKEGEKGDQEKGTKEAEGDKKEPPEKKTEGEEEGEVMEVIDVFKLKVAKVVEAGEVGFEKWLRSRSIQELEGIVEVDRAQQHEKTGEYLGFAKKYEVLKVCGSCRYSHGCERCSYEHALRYVVRHRQPAKWWLKRAGEVLRKKSTYEGFEI